MSGEKLDMSVVSKLLREVDDLVDALHGAPMNVDIDNNKERMRANAQRSRDLLYAAHLADLIRAEIISQYHRFKGQEPPTLSV